jgi:hypothetical protein
MKGKVIMSKLLMSVLAGSLILASSIAGAASPKADDPADATYKTATAQCKSQKGNAKDVCMAEAKAERKKAKAQAEADKKGDEKSRTKVKEAAAEADYDVAKAKCGAKKGNDKDVCIKEAKAGLTRAKADAKAGHKAADAKADAKQDTRDADYKVAIEKCDAMKGDAKDKCVAQAKARFGK